MTVGEVIRQLVTDWDTTPYTINGGQCEEFACEVVSRLDAEGLGCGMGEVYTEDMWTDDYYEGKLDAGHCWVRGDGQNYDAECPEGVMDWRQLPFFLRVLGE